MLSTVWSAAVHGLDGVRVAVEVDLQRGLQTFHLVGLPSPAVRESRERVQASLRNAGFTFPERRITVNLAPAELPKEGAAFDLAIALGILSASKQCDLGELAGTCVLGEMSLDGSVRPVRGVLPIVIAMQRAGVRRVLVPAANAAEAALVPGVEVRAAATLHEAVAACSASVAAAVAPPRASAVSQNHTPAAPDGPSQPASVHGFSQVWGQESAKRALAVAAAGGHAVLMEGPPGVGKSMLARALPGLLPPLAASEALDVRQVLSVCGQHREAAAAAVQRPFRAPHHTITVPALVGGGRPLRPGEITRAMHGVLFLDELPEFGRSLLDLLRQPLEEGVIELGRANLQVRFPARFQLVAAMNPCPCGYRDHPRRVCRCTPGEVQRYRGRVSGPILDRIDLRVRLGVPPAHRVGTPPDPEADAALRERIAMARARQAQRYRDVPGVHCNAQADAATRRRRIRPRPEARALLQRALSRWNLSVRAHERVLAVARSIADLDGASDVGVPQVAEALQYRVEGG